MSAPRVLFLADRLATDPRGTTETHPGGAELTDAAALEASPWPVEAARVREFDPQRLRDYDLHILGNLSEAKPDLLLALRQASRHVLFEHDLRICRWRGNFPSSPEPLHRYAQSCNCPHRALADLYKTALGAIFLTHRQLATHLSNPFFRCPRAVVLGSSLMNRAFFERVRRAREPGQGTVVVHSANRIKGSAASERWCHQQGFEPSVLRDVPPDAVLDAFERACRVVYLPQGLEPAGRIIVEARFLGCEVVTNGNAGVCGESWWHLPDEQALAVLADAPARFWRLLQHLMAQPGAAAHAGGRVAFPAMRAADRRNAIERFPPRR